MSMEHIINPLLDQLGKEQEKQDIREGDLDWEGPEEAELPRVFCLLTRTRKDPRKPSYHVIFILLTKSETKRKQRTGVEFREDSLAVLQYKDRTLFHDWGCVLMLSKNIY